MKSTRTHFNQRSLAFIVLITGVVGGLLVVFSILLLCKYCLNRKSLKEAEQMKLLYDTLNQVSLIDSDRLYHRGIRDFSPLEPRRSNPLDRYQLPEDQWQIPSSKQISSDYHSTGSQHSHNLSFHDSREQNNMKQLDNHLYSDVLIDDESAEQAYLQVDPRCYVRQNSNASLLGHRKSDTPRLEKGHSLNVDTRPSPSGATLSPYRQSSFDVTLAYRSQQVAATPSPSQSTLQEVYYTPRGSNLSILTNPLGATAAAATTTPTATTSPQHLSAPSTAISRKNSAALILEKKDLTATFDPSGQTVNVRCSVVPREHEHSRSLEQSTPPLDQLSSSPNASTDKQSRSFDAVHLLRPGSLRPESAINRRTKSYENADDHRQARPSIAPPPIVIKIPDMTELVQAAQLSRLQKRRESAEMEEYQRNTSRKPTLVQQISIDDHHESMISPEDLWRLRQSYEMEEEEHPSEHISPDDFSVDLLTSTSIDSAGAMPIDTKGATGGDDDPSKYQYRRKSSSNLLLPPPEVRRQALRRTFEKRRSCINQSNARREQQQLAGLDDEHQTLSNSKLDFSNLLKNLNSKSENSSFERSLETDFDMQSDTSSRGPNDQFTSIESSGNENPPPDPNNRILANRRQPAIQQSPQISPHQDDSGYKSLESQNSQNRTFSLDWMSADGAESVIYVGDSRLQQRSVDVKDLDDQLAQQEYEQKTINQNRRSPKLLHTGLHHSYQEGSSMGLAPPNTSNTPMMQQRSLSTNIPLVDHDIPTPMNLSLLSNTNRSLPMNNNEQLDEASSFTRTASKKRREFSKEKRNVSSNAGVSQSPTSENPQTSVQQINEKSSRSMGSSSLQVRHPDLRRTKSAETRNHNSPDDCDSLTNEVPPAPNATKSDTRLSSSTDGILVSAPLPSTSSAIRRHLSPNSNLADVTPQQIPRSPTSSTPPVSRTTSTEAFRSQRGSISFDTQNPLLHSTTNKNKTSANHALIPTCITKPRLRFSLVRDTALAGLTHNAPIYSMPITRDYSIDEKTNRIVNEFLMHDPMLEESKRNASADLASRGLSKRHYHHHHRIRAKTLEEPATGQQTTTNPTNLHQTTTTTGAKQLPQQPTRSVSNKQRYYSSLQTNLRKHSQHQYPSLHLTDSFEQVEEEDDSSDPTSPLSTFNQTSNTTIVRRENSLAAAGSPSIIITGDDSGS